MTTTIIVTIIIALGLIALIGRNIYLTDFYSQKRVLEEREMTFVERPLATPEWVNNAVMYQAKRDGKNRVRLEVVAADALSESR